MKNGSFSSFIAKEWRHILRERRTLVMQIGRAHV